MPPIFRESRTSSKTGVDVGGDGRAERQAAEPHHRVQREVQHQVGQHRDDADDDRRARVLQRVEARRRDLHDRIADDARRVEQQGLRREQRRRGVEPAALIEQLDDRTGRAPSVRRSRARSTSASAASPHESVVRMSAMRLVGRVARKIRNGRRGDRDAEDADRHVHQPKRVAERRDGAVLRPWRATCSRTG